MISRHVSILMLPVGFFTNAQNKQYSQERFSYVKTAKNSNKLLPLLRTWPWATNIQVWCYPFWIIIIIIYFLSFCFTISQLCVIPNLNGRNVAGFLGGFSHGKTSDPNVVLSISISRAHTKFKQKYPTLSMSFWQIPKLNIRTPWVS